MRVEKLKTRNKIGSKLDNGRSLAIMIRERKGTGLIGFDRGGGSANAVGFVEDKDVGRSVQFLKSNPTRPLLNLEEELSGERPFSTITEQNFL